MESIEQAGRNVEEAVGAALEVLGVSRDDVDVEVLAEESRGLLGILGHSQAHGIPLAVLKLPIGGRFILRCVKTFEAR